jgi:hypothetical protein
VQLVSAVQLVSTVQLASTVQLVSSLHPSIRPYLKRPSEVGVELCRDDKSWGWTQTN